MISVRESNKVFFSGTQTNSHQTAQTDAQPQTNNNQVIISSHSTNNSSVYGSQASATSGNRTPDPVSRNGSNSSVQNTLQLNSDKFNVCRENIPYLAALLPVSTEVQSKLNLRYKNYRLI